MTTVNLYLIIWKTPRGGRSIPLRILCLIGSILDGSCLDGLTVQHTSVYKHDDMNFINYHLDCSLDHAYRSPYSINSKQCNMSQISMLMSGFPYKPVNIAFCNQSGNESIHQYFNMMNNFVYKSFHNI